MGLEVREVDALLCLFLVMSRGEGEGEMLTRFGTGESADVVKWSSVFYIVELRRDEKDDQPISCLVAPSFL
jgi:hypothetical protein